MKKNDYASFWVIVSYLKPYKGRFIIAALSSVGVAACNAAMVRLVQPLIDDIHGAAAEDLVIWVPVIIFALSVLLGVCRYLQSYFMGTSAQLVVRDLRGQVFDHVIDLPMGFHSENKSGNLLSIIMNDINVMQHQAAKTLVTLCQESFTLIGLLGVAFYMDWKLALVSISVIPLVALPASTIGSRIKRYSRKGQGAMADLTGLLEQVLSGVKVIKSFGTESAEKTRFQTTNNLFYLFRKKMIKYDSLAGPMVQILSSFGIAAVAWFGVTRVLDGGLTQGEMSAIFVAIALIYTPVKKLIGANNHIKKAMGAAERVFALLENVSNVHDPENPVALDQVRGKVDFLNLSFSYGEQAVLTDISISAKPGEVVALVGASGAGKSTLAGLLNRFYDPNQGKIQIDGVDIRDLPISFLKRHIALVDQETFLFNDSIYSNILYGSFDASMEQVTTAARQAFAEGFIQELPEGYDTEIGDRGARLSGGQRQRICIARALLKDAPILILDEATSALDTESEAAVQKALQNLMADRTTFVIAHRISTIMNADQIVVMKEGSIVERGTYEELQRHGGYFAQLASSQLR